MKDYDKYIFDLDYTLLIPDWSKEDDYFKETIDSSIQEEFFRMKQTILNNYAIEYPKYDFQTLSDYFKSYGLDVSVDVIKGWAKYNSETIKDEVVDGVFELFDYLKKKNKKIVILTNWYSGTQIPRIKRTGLYDYVDYVIAGDDAMKPELLSFELAIGDSKKEDCIMIGDNIISDKEGSQNAGIDFYLIDENHSIKDLLNLISNID